MDRGGGNTSSNNNGSTNITITIPKAASSSTDINLLGDFELSATSGFVYEIYFENTSYKSEHKTASEGGKVTFDNVKYDTYDFCLDIYVHSNKKTKLPTIKVNKTISASNNTVQFPDMKTSDYSEWFLVKNADGLRKAVSDILSKFTAEKKAKLCLLDNIEYPGFASLLATIEGKYERIDNGFKIAEELFDITIASPIDGGTVETSPTKASLGDPITLTITPDEEKELGTLTVTGVAAINYNEAKTKATFTMPSSDVTVTASFKTKKYTLSLPSSTGGSVTVSDAPETLQFAKNDTITLVITPDDEWMLETLSVSGVEAEAIRYNSDNTRATFEMPSGNVSVTASFKIKKYTLTLPSLTGGSITVTDASEPLEFAKDASVTLSVATSAHYRFKKLIVDDEDKTSNVVSNSYTFQMPNHDVSVDAVFAQLYSISVSTTPSGTTGGTVSVKVGDTAVDEAEDGESVTVTLSAAASYDIESLKKGTTNVTSSISSGTYTFDMGSAAVSLSVIWKAAEADSIADVGDVALSNGKFVSKDNVAKMSASQQAAAVAVIFDTSSRLGVGLKQEMNKMWAYLNGTGYTTSVNALICTTTPFGAGAAENASLSFSGEQNGANSLETLKASVGSDYSKGTYTAWGFVEDYATIASLAGDYATGWYLPSIAELCKLYKANAAVNESLDKITGADKLDAGYWSSSQYGSNDVKAYYVNFSTGSIYASDKNSKYKVRAIRVF